MEFVINIDSMDEADYSRFRQFFDLMAMAISGTSVAEALMISVPDDVAPVVVRMAGEMGAVWYRLKTADNGLSPRIERMEEKKATASVSVETADHIDLVKEPNPPAPFPVREGGVERRCKNCGEPIRMGDYCPKQECKRVYARTWYHENKGKKKGEGPGEKDSRHDPFGQTGAEAGDRLSVEAG